MEKFKDLKNVKRFIVRSIIRRIEKWEESLEDFFFSPQIENNFYEILSIFSW